MWRAAIALVLAAAACSGDDPATTDPPTTTAAPSTTATTTPATTTAPSTTTTSSTTTTTLSTGFTALAHELFTTAVPESWNENPDFPGTGAGFLEDHTALALPPTSLDIFFENQEAGFDIDDHIELIQDDLAFFVPDFRVLESGEQEIDGVRSVWFQYSEQFDGFPVVIREQVALRDTTLVTFTLISPVEFFEFDVGQVQQVLESFRFS